MWFCTKMTQCEPGISIRHVSSKIARDAFVRSSEIVQLSSYNCNSTTYNTKQIQLQKQITTNTERN